MRRSSDPDVDGKMGGDINGRRSCCSKGRVKRTRVVEMGSSAEDHEER